MKKILFLLLLLPLFAYPQAEKRHRSIIIDSVKALNGGIVDIKDSASFEKPVGMGGVLDVSAILTLSDTSKGFLVPRMTAVQRNNIVSPATGLLVFDTDSNAFLFFDSSAWTKIIDGNGGVGDMLKAIYDTNNDGIVNNADTLNGDIDISQIVGLSVGDSSFVTLQTDTFKAFNNTNIQVVDSVIHQEHLQTNKSFTVNLGLTTLIGIDATSGNYVLKLFDNTGVTNLLNVRNDGLLTVLGRIDQQGLGGSIYLGFEAGLNDDLTNNNNVAIGHQALSSSISGLTNVAIGFQSASSIVSTAKNTSVGYMSLFTSTGSSNVAIGFNALRNSTTGTNTAIGTFSMQSTSDGQFNTASGFESLLSNTEGNRNTASGHKCLEDNTLGDDNSAFGYATLQGNVSGDKNSAFGSAALLNTTGSFNIAFGVLAGANITTGSNNIIIGQEIDAPSATGSNQMSIGNLIFGTGIDGTGTSISSGNIGIGINNPSARLHVKGKDTLITNFALSVEDSAGNPLFNIKNIGDVIANRTFNYWTDTSSVNDNYGAIEPLITAYTTGMSFYINVGVANTGAATFQFNALAALFIKKLHNQDLVTGDIEAGQIIHLIYDGTNLQVLSQLAQ